jgi:hypothetical protein
MTVPCQMAVNKGEVKQLDLNGFHSQPCEGQFDLQTTIINKCYNKVLQSWQMNHLSYKSIHLQQFTCACRRNIQPYHKCM